MKKLLYYPIAFIFLMIFIPILVLGGIGNGISISNTIRNIPNIIDDKPVSSGTKNIVSGDKIKVFVDSQNKIVEMNVEDYIKGVVSAEMPVLFNIEALKAQAVAARTFAYANMKSRGGSGCSLHKDADVCSDVHCQAWISKEERFKNWDSKDAVSNWAKVEEAVDSTSGIVLVYDSKIIPNIKYHSTSGGKTEDAINVFGYDVPYLKSVDSLGEEESPSYQSTQVIKIDEFIKKIKEINTSVKISASNIKNQIKIDSLTTGGRVKTITIGDKTFSGVDIRWALGLKSANFTVQVDSKNVTFNVRGYGHGVGMSQWGANEMGKGGKKYDEILKHYYQGVEIKKITEIK